MTDNDILIFFLIFKLVASLGVLALCILAVLELKKPAKGKPHLDDRADCLDNGKNHGRPREPPHDS